VPARGALGEVRRDERLKLAGQRSSASVEQMRAYFAAIHGIPSRCIVAQELAQPRARSRQTRLDGAYGASKDLGELLLREPLEVEENDGAGVERQRPKRRLDVVRDDISQSVELVIPAQRLSSAALVGGLVVEAIPRRVDLCATPTVDVQVAQDAEKPGAQVRARHVLRAASEGTRVRLLHEVLGFRGIVRDTERQPVQGVEMLERQGRQRWSGASAHGRRIVGRNAVEADDGASGRLEAGRPWPGQTAT
jgi:hypothetical protein